MKKLLVLSGIIILSFGASFASMEESTTSDIDILRKQGFSESMLQVVDLARYNGSQGKEKRYYVSTATNKKGKKLGRAYSYIKTYVDPIQDDGMFGEHQVNFSNSWDWGKNHYSERYRKSESVENL